MPVERGCLNTKALLHMLFHILGRYHEHERADREEYVDVIEENIIEGTCTCIIYYPTSCYQALSLCCRELYLPESQKQELGSVRFIALHVYIYI